MDGDQVTDPTPRTAATARDELLEEFREMGYGHLPVVARRLDDLIALAAAEAPGRVAALVEELRPNCGKLRNLHGPLMGLGYAAALDDILAAPAAPAPTPSEPVERVDGMAAFVAGFRMRHEWPGEAIGILRMAEAVHSTKALLHKADRPPLECAPCRDEALGLLIALGMAPSKHPTPATRDE